MRIKDTLEITWNKILIVWFWWQQNMWDELILLWTIRLLWKQGKEIYIISPHNQRLKEFLWQFIDITKITFVDELPRWFTWLWNRFVLRRFEQIKHFFAIDTVILWGWEILTEESPHAYYYWLWSIRPALFLRKNFYLMWWIQVPKKRWNIFLFKQLLRKTDAIYTRDFEEITAIKNFWYDRVSFFMDTSYFAISDRKKYKKNERKPYIVVNINSKWQRFMEDFIQDIKKYLKDWYRVIYVPVFAWVGDDDSVYFYDIQKKLGKNPYFTLYDRRKNFEAFLSLLWWAKKVIWARLHLFLISSFIGLPTKVYPYQKKIQKMQQALTQLHL